MDPTGDNKVSHPELEVTSALLEHETWEREAHMRKKDGGGGVEKKK